MVRWALSHEDDEGFDPARVLVAWAEKRGRGAWSGRPRSTPKERLSPNGELARALADHWGEHPEELAAVLDRAQANRNGDGRS